MNGIIINIDPVIFHLGGFELRWYSLMIMLAIAAAVLISAYRGKKRGIAGEEIYSLAVWVIISGIIGARLFHVIDHLSYYVSHPAQILQFQGLAIWGGLAGGGAAVIAFSRIRSIPLGRLADVVAPALITAQIIGRVGCIINGDAYGGITGLPWGFIYTNPGAFIPASLFGQPTHPYPVYEMLWNTAALLGILQIERRFRTDGLVFLNYLSLYSAGRFLLTFVRQENAFLWGLQQAQLIALLTVILSLSAMVYLTRKPVSKSAITYHQGP
ncbi:MAG: prolipoprotein diacylglyceryl transferase [Dehalococcoidales bacterium]|nr:prolipoprotein diacylglyceryl transferase [Dehalococcoidales bacterium]